MTAAGIRAMNPAEIVTRFHLVLHGEEIGTFCVPHDPRHIKALRDAVLANRDYISRVIRLAGDGSGEFGGMFVVADSVTPDDGWYKLA